MHSTTIAAAPATEKGQLDGHKVTCTCGTILTTSLGEAAARHIAGQHLDWHARKDGGRR